MTARTVLQQADISRALTRISHEILESNRGTNDLVILGIPTRGVVLARRIAENIQRIEPQGSAQGVAGFFRQRGLDGLLRDGRAACAGFGLGHDNHIWLSTRS